MTAPVHSVRIYCPDFPWPVTEGGFHLAYDQARGLTDLGLSVELLSWKTPRQEIARRLIAHPGFSEAILIGSLHAGEYSQGRATEWRARFGGEPAQARRESMPERISRVAASAFTGMASPEAYYYTRGWDRRDLLPRVDLGVYHYSFAYNWLRHRRGGAEDSVVVYFQNLESDLSRLRSKAARLPAISPESALHRLNAHKLGRHEGELLRLADELWFVSAVDLAEYRRRHGGGDLLRLVPPTFDPVIPRRRRQALTATPARDETVLGFVGGCDYEPNRASLQWIIDHLAPELARAGFGGRIRVAGRGVPAELRARAEPFGFFEWLGFVPDLEPFWASLSFLLVPQVGGSGIRIKLLEGLASGIPVLVNGEAAAPLSPELRASALLICNDDPAAWAARIMAEPGPQATRREFGGSELEPGLRGERTYHFLTRRNSVARAANS